MMFKFGQNKTLTPIKETKIDLEKDLQSLTESNLDLIFGLKFIRSEFSHQNFRIDTLAFDDETKSFVIIEFKRDRSFSVIDQGFSYLSLMLNNKADFILEYNEKMKDTLRREDVDWTQSRVLFLANSFTTYQQNAINFRDLPIELWEVKKFDNDTILYNQFESTTARESLNTITSNETIKSVSVEVKKYNIEDHFPKGREQVRELFDNLSERILSLDSRIIENPKKAFIGFKIGNKNIVGVTIQNAKMVVDFMRTQPKDLNDPEKKLRYIENSIKYYNQHMSSADVKDYNDIGYIMSLIKQVYEKHYK